MSDDLTYFVMRSGCEVPHKHGELSAITSRHILCGLALHADKDTGTLFVSSRGLARELKINHNTTFLAYKLYEQHGVLVRTGKRRGNGGAIEYRLNFDHLTPQNEFYKAPTSPSTQATSPRTSDPQSSPLGSPLSSPLTDPSTQALNRNRNENTTTARKNVEALFEQALKVELEFRPCLKFSFEQLAIRKRSDYLPVCELVLAEFPAAQPSETPDRELALLVAGKLNPGLPALQLTEASRRELDKRYRTQPESSPVPLTADELRELTKTQPLRSNLPKRRPD